MAATNRKRQRIPANSPDHPRMKLAREREDQLYAFDLQGVPLTTSYSMVGYDTYAGAYKALQRGRARHHMDVLTLEQYRTRALARNEEIRVELNRLLARPHPVVSLQTGKVIMVERTDRATGEKRMVELEDPRVKLETIRTIDLINRRDAAIIGYDSATRYEHTGPEGAPIQVDLGVLIERAHDVAKLQVLRPVELPPASNGSTP